MNNVILPPGIDNNAIEIYHKDQEPCATHDGTQKSFWLLPRSIINSFKLMFCNDKTAQDAIIKYWGITNPNKMFEKWTVCLFGGYNNVPDFDDNKITPDYWNCGERGKCPCEGLVCKIPEGKNGKLSKQEYHILFLLTKGHLDKEIADILQISINTVKTHNARLFHKLGINTRIEAAFWLHYKNNQ